MYFILYECTIILWIPRFIQKIIRKVKFTYRMFSTSNLNLNVQDYLDLRDLNQTSSNIVRKKGQNPRHSSKVRLSTFQNLLNVKQKIKIAKSIFPNSMIDHCGKGCA